MFDRFDICEAYYIYAMEYHEGGGSRIYQIFSRLIRVQFKPAPSLVRRGDLTENGQEIFDNLVSTHHLSQYGGGYAHSKRN